MLGSNDSSFNDGTGIGAGAIGTAALAAGAVGTANIKTDGTGVANANLNTTAGDLGGAWKAFTPSFTGVTNGNATLAGYYTQIGKTIHLWAYLKYGTTTTGFPGSLVLPVTSINYVNAYSVSLGNGTVYAGGVIYPEIVQWVDINTLGLFASDASLAYVGHKNNSASIPLTWGTGSMITTTATYQAA